VAQSPITGSPSQVPSAVVPPPCPRRATRKRPRVVVYTSAVKAQRALHLPPSETLADAADPDGGPYSTMSFIPPSHEGDRGSYVLVALFPRGSELVVVPDLATNTTARPADACMQVDQHEIVEMRVAGSSRRVGHFRLLREGVTDAPTLPAQSTGQCTDRVGYRIEDHFIDLERGAYLAVYDQVYEDGSDRSRALPGASFDAFAIDGAGIVPTSCR
jgi:hypothetical protein